MMERKGPQTVLGIMAAILASLQHCKPLMNGLVGRLKSRDLPLPASVGVPSVVDLRFFPSLRLHPEFVRSVLAGGHDESRTGTEGFVGVGGVDLFTWCLPADDVSMAERMAMAA
jgi:hypothetical protein